MVDGFAAFIQQIKHLTGSLAGLGFLPVAPGTWASLATLLFVYPVSLLTGMTGLIFLVLGSSLLSLWAAGACENKWGRDPAVFVMDEFAGQSLTFLFTVFSGEFPADVFILVTGFLLFRFFDILKPLGIHRLQHLPSGFGILLDDLLSGIYACIILQLLLLTLSVF